MRYKPVTVVHVTQVPGLAGMKRREWLALATDNEKMRAYPNYWQARSNARDCGHKHKTPEAAKPCERKLLKEWHERRVEQCKAASKSSAKRRALRAACDTFSNTMPAVTAILRMANGL